MNKIVKSIAFVFLFALSAQVFSQGYNIKFKINGAHDSLFQIAVYYGKYQTLIDSAFADSKGNIVFKGSDTLSGGIYLLAMNKKHLFDFIIDKEQQIQFETDTSNYIGHMKVKGSIENKVFFDYQQVSVSNQLKIKPYQDAYGRTKDNKDSAAFYRAKMDEIIKTVISFQDSIKKNYPNSLWVKVLKCTEEIKVPDPPTLPNGKKDSIWSYYYYKNHYWDNYDLMDSRMLRTPMFHEKLANYFDKVVIQSPDTITKEAKSLIDRTYEKGDLFKYMVWFVTYNYETSKIMGFDAVFVDMVDAYYKTNKAWWASPSTNENMIKRAERIRSTMIGKKAPELIMPDSNNRYVSFYNLKANYTFLIFWDTDCGHCKKELPLIKDFYDKYKKEYGIEVFAIDIDSDLARWKKYISEHNHTWYSVTGTSANVDYRDIYDIYSTPVIFILDKDKKVIAKRIGSDQLEDFMKNYSHKNK